MTLMSSDTAGRQPYAVDHMLRSLSGNRLAAEKLVRIFLEMYPSKMALFDSALQASDWVSLRRVVHDLRGTCAIVAATSCLASAATLEDALPDHVSAQLYFECECFKSALGEVAATLRRFLTEATGDPEHVIRQ